MPSKPRFAARSARSTQARLSVGRVRGRTAAPPPPRRVVVDVETLRRRADDARDGLFEPAGPRRRLAALDGRPCPIGAGAHGRPTFRRSFNSAARYMMFEHDHGVVLIDQHSAHERVLYEQFMRTLERGEQPAQRLLFPMTLHLGPAESEAFERNREVFERLGFEIEGFGGHTLLVRAVPMPHPRFDPERCLRETLAALTGDRDAGAHARHERLAATVACKAAIKAGDALSPGEMRALFIALRDTTLPAHDVHGRATIVQLTWDEIERRFGRTLTFA